MHARAACIQVQRDCAQRTSSRCWRSSCRCMPPDVTWHTAGTERRLKESARQAGLSDGRIIFTDTLASTEHIAAKGLADIFLDTPVQRLPIRRSALHPPTIEGPDAPAWQELDGNLVGQLNVVQPHTYHLAGVQCACHRRGRLVGGVALGRSAPRIHGCEDLRSPPPHSGRSGRLPHSFFPGLRWL